jgi:iron complex outermembrane receptor protein
MISKLNKLARASLFALAISQGSAAFAQQTTSSTEAQADEQPAQEIIVTAQFRQQSVQDTPLAITAVSGAALEAQGQKSLVDIGSSVPSVNLSTATAINANAVAAFIRGIGQEDSNFALEPGVGIYIDDVYFGTTYGASLDLVDLDRVEVLRGPQGTLAGKNSLGGAIKLYSRKPDEDFGGFVQGGYGRFNRVEARGSLNVPLAPGLYSRVSASYRKDDGYFKELDYGCVNPGQGLAATGRADANCVLGRAGGADVLSMRGALRYAPTDSRVEINLVGDYTRDRSQPVANKLRFASNANNRTYDASNPFAGVPFDSRFLTPEGSYTSYADYGAAGNFTTVFCLSPGVCAPYQIASGTYTTPRQNSVDGWGLAGTVDIELSDDLKLKSITAYRKAVGTSVIDIDGTPINILKETLNARHEQFSQELRLSGKVGDALDFTVGGYYYKANDRMNQRINIPVFLYDFLANDLVSNRSMAGFVHAEWHATDKLNFIGGIRYTADKKVYNYGRTNADGSAISGVPLTLNFLVASLNGLSGTFNGKRWDFRAGVNYNWTDRIMTYAQVATGYKGGGVNPRPFVADQVTSFGPEKLTTYEAGFKSSFLGGDVVLNGSLFYNDYADIQRTIYVCPTSASTTCGMPVNAGTGRSYGAEIETVLRPIAGLQINGSLGLLDFKYKSINPYSGVTLDMQAPFHNKVTASAGIQYRADLGNSGFLTPRFDVSYQSSFYYQPINNATYNKIAGRAIANVRLTYANAGKAWEISAGVTNLFDKYYYVAASENLANFGMATSIVGRPREWSISVKRSF